MAIQFMCKEKRHIEKLIANGQEALAIEKLLTISSKVDRLSNKDYILISNRYQRQHKKNKLGLISDRELDLVISRVVHYLLESLDALFKKKSQTL